ncbi:MAG: hypothetical protein ACTS46_01935 [Candidatus Hodgkinia cicadicola]
MDSPKEGAPHWALRTNKRCEFPFGSSINMNFGWTRFIHQVLTSRAERNLNCVRKLLRKSDSPPSFGALLTSGSFRAFNCLEHRAAEAAFQLNMNVPAGNILRLTCDRFHHRMRSQVNRKRWIMERPSTTSAGLSHELAFGHHGGRLLRTDFQLDSLLIAFAKSSSRNGTLRPAV